MFPDFKVTFNNREVNESLNVDSGEEEVDEDTSRCEEPEESKHKISYRQNNIPLSHIPASIIDEIRKQRKTRKSVAIATSKEYLSLHKKTPKLLSVCAPGSTCSDPDTHSTMTNDSDYENSKPMTPNNEKMINQAKSQGVKNMQMIKTDSGKKINSILSESKSSPMLQRPAKMPKIVRHEARPQAPPPVHLHVEPVNFETVEFELVKRDQYRFDDFYRFDSSSHNSNMHYLLSDDYYQNLKQDLGRKLKFSFLNESGDDLYEDANEYNMAFQSVAEASSYVLTGKRKCFVNVHNL